MKIAAYVPDLMDRSRFEGLDVSFAASPGELAEAEDADVYVIDLGRDGALAAVADLAANGRRVIGFGSHVDEDLLAAAREAGCTEVLPRSRFFARLRELL